MMRHTLRSLSLALALAFGVSAMPACAQDGAAEVDPATLPADHPDAVVEFTGPETVILEGADGPAEFTVDVAVTNRARQRGLMFREELAPDAGMLFFYDQPQVASIWMKNTLIPLDILYVDEDGLVVKIVRNAVPGSLVSMPSGTPVVAVLEIAGGRAAELGVEPGSTMHHLVFGNMDEAG